MVTKYQVHLYSKRVVDKLVKEGQFKSEHLVIQTHTTHEALVLLHEKTAALHNMNQQLLNSLSSSIAEALTFVDQTKM